MRFCVAIVGMFLLCIAGVTRASDATTRPSKEAVSRPAGPLPQVQFEQTEYRFNRIEVGKDLVHTFKAKNVGQAPMRIISVRPACGCTVVEGWKKEVSPGGSWELPVTFKTAAFSGNVTKTVLVETSDPKAGKVELKLVGEIVARFRCEPKEVFQFGRLERDAVTSQTIKIVNQLEPSIKLTTAKVLQTDVITGKLVDAPSFKAVIRETDAGKNCELVVSTVPPIKEGPIQGTIELTAANGEPSLRLPFYAQVQPRIEVLPQVLTLPDKIPAKMTRTITVRNSEKSKAKVMEVVSTESAIKAEMKPSKDGKQCMITLTIPAGTAIPAKGAEITIKTDDKVSPQLTIPISAVPAKTVSVPTTRPATSAPVRGTT